jgi:hypothetical protein
MSNTHFDANIIGGSPESFRTKMAAVPCVGRPDLLGQNLAEQIRRHEVSRILEKMDLSPEEEEAVERLSYSLVVKLLLGPISEAMARRDSYRP